MPKSRNRRRSSPNRSSTRPNSGSAGRATPKLPVQVTATGRRGRAERASAPVLVWLSGLPSFLLPVVSVLLLVAGLAAPTAIGVPILLVLLVLLFWLSYLSWPAVHGVQRFLRLGVVGLLLAAVLGRLSA